MSRTLCENDEDENQDSYSDLSKTKLEQMVHCIVIAERFENLITNTVLTDHELRHNNAMI